VITLFVEEPDQVLFREHHPAVRAHARRRAPPEAVDDIVSETFLVVWLRLDEVRIAVLAGAVAAAVFVVANVASTGNGSAVSPAQAQAILRHVRAALVWPSRAIYEEEDVGTVTARDGATHTSGSHEWLSTSPPSNSRIIEILNGKVLWEQAFVNRRLDLYDPTTNTIYLAPGVAPNQTTDEPQWNSALSEVQYLLGQPNVTVNPNAVLDGARAIELTFDGGRFS
jgi:Sigma-70 region 2